ncbi:unnamed protein product [Camellia sinensis]
MHVITREEQALRYSTGNADEANQLYRNALQVLTDSKCMHLDDNIMEKMIDLAELLHLVGRKRRSSLTLHKLNQYVEAEQLAQKFCASVKRHLEKNLFQLFSNLNLTLTLTLTLM